MKKLIALLLSVLCLFVTVPALAGDSPKATVYADCSPWAYASLEEATANGLLPNVFYGADMSEAITRAEFAAVLVALWEALAEETAVPAAAGTFIDTSDAEVLKAYNLGLTSGVSATEFGPEVVLNREQMATMLTRVYKKIHIPGWNLENDGNYNIAPAAAAKFADHGQISDWAVDGVYIMFSSGAISGVGDNSFAPKNPATREQAVIVSLLSYRDARETIAKAIADSVKPAAGAQETANPQAGGETGGKLSGVYLDILGSGNYYMKYRMETAVEGEKISGTVEIAVRGDDSAQISDMMGMKIVMIFMGGKIYMVDHDSQTVMVMSASMAGSTGVQSDVPDIGLTYKGTGTATLFGISRVYEEYATDSAVVRYYFDGSKLVGMETTVDSVSMQMEILELSNDIPAGMFDIPSGYEKIEF